VIAIELALHAAISGGPALAFRPAMLLYGPEIHLWFFPFAAVAGVGDTLMQPATARRSRPEVLTWSAIAVSVAGVASYPWVGHGWPFEHWSFGIPAVRLGFACGRTLAGTA
jgi:hypothetical protein